VKGRGARWWRIDEGRGSGPPDHMWAAKKGLQGRPATQMWMTARIATVDSASLIRQLEEASKQPGVVAPQ